MGFPKQILILRHAEKPQDKHNENLSTKGYERAAALAYYLPDTFAKVDHIFAAGIGHHSPSHRPVETITPLADRLGLKIHQKYLKDDHVAMVNHILDDDKYTDTIIVICWEHTDIESISSAFGATNVPSTPWPGTIFDLVWQLSLVPSQNTYNIEQIPQLLLYGDTKTKI